MPEHTEIRIRKEALKFAAAHMTVFPDGTKEALHGHQYLPTLKVGVKDASIKSMLPFVEFKTAMKKIAKLWDEKVLIATENPHYQKIKHTKQSLEFTLCKKRYVLPTEEVVLLKFDNITCEQLAHAYFQFLNAELESIFEQKNVLYVNVYIEESPGQGASFCYDKRA
jgi:6-pyruvoyltetrahydropterin/6-carboxytetrahydropterin synthase